MAFTIERGPQVKIGVRIGYAKAPTAKMVVMSLSNAAASVDCNSVNYPITWVATDTDSGGAPAGYTASITIAGLSEFMLYSYTGTQGANSVAGSFRTLPGEFSDFCFYALSCDAGASVSGGVNTGHGFYKNIKAQQVQAGGLPCVGILHVDDHGYNSDRRFSDEAAPGLSAYPPSTLLTKYAYAAAWLNYYGLHTGSGDSGLGDASLATTTANTDIGRNPDRVWCMRNLPVWPQWGDWEFANDIGMDFPTNDPTGGGNGYHKTYSVGIGQRDGGGLLAWQTFMGPLQPPSIASTDTYANHWAFDLGCIRMIATDGITNCNGNVSNPDDWDTTISAGDANVAQVGSMLGMGQITDILAAVNPNAAFTMLGLMNGIRYMDNVVSKSGAGTQHPIKNHCPAEFAALFTGAGSLASKRQTLFTLGGDFHNGHIYHHEITDGAIPSDFYEVGLGTCTGSSNHSGAGVQTPDGAAYRGSTIEQLFRGAAGGNNYWGVKVSVYGSKAVKELVIELMDANSAVLWSAKFLSRNGTTKFADDYAVPTIVGTVHV